MPDGVRLGGAFYEVTADAAPLLQAMAQAEARAKASAQAIAQSTGLTERAVQRLANTAIREEKRRADAAAQATVRIIKAHNDAAAAADKAVQKQATQQANAQFLSLTKSLGGFAVAATGVTVGAAAINQAMTSIAESTQKAAQAQFALNALYGQAAPIIQKQAEELAKTSGRSRTEATEAAVAVANLGRQYGLTFEQQRKVMQISADVAAIRGLPLEEATQRVSDAIRGEAEAAEYLGQVLNSDAIKAMAKMTDEQRKNFESLGPLEKAQIVLGKLEADNADLRGLAAKRTQDAAGATDNLKTATDNLAASIGKAFSPEVVAATNTLAGFVAKGDEFARSDFVPKLRQAAGLMAAMASLDPSTIARTLLQVNAGAEGRIQVGPDAGLPGAGAGPTAAQAQALEEGRRQAQRDAEAEKTRIKTFVENRKRAIEQAADAEEKALRKQADLRDQAIDREKIRLEVEQAARLKALEERERSTLRAIEAEQKAEEKASEANIARLEREKDARIAAATAAKDAVEQAVEAEERRLDREREVQDRERDDARRAEDQAREDARRDEERATEEDRRKEDRARDRSLDAEIKRIEERRDFNLAAMEEEVEKYQRASERRQRAIDREADKARANSEKALSRLERQGEREDVQRRKRMQALDDERDAQLAILDARLRGLDAADRAEDAARRTSDLQKRLAAAQRGVTTARGTGTPQQIEEARAELTRAIQGKNEISIANARERLAQLAGQGTEAIREAEEELAEAQEALRNEGVEQQREAERTKLRNAQEAIRKEIEDRKRAEEEEDRERKRSLEREQEAERGKLKATLERLEKKKQATKDTDDEELRLLRNGLEEERKAAGEQTRIARERFEQDTQILQDRRREEDAYRNDQRLAQDRARQDERQAQDRARQDERQVQDQALKDRLAAANVTFEQERRDAEAHFNGPNGLITQARAAQEAMKEAHRQRLIDEKLIFDQERDQIKAVYRNEAKTGLLDLQDQAAANNRTKLGDQLTDLENWKNQSNTWIDENKTRWTGLAQAVEAVSTAIKNIPAAPKFVRPTFPGGQPVPGPFLEETTGGGGGTAAPARPEVPPSPMGAPGASYSPVVRGAGRNSYVTSAGTHGGHPAADIFAAAGTPIYSPVGGRLSSFYDRTGGNAAILHGDDGRAYYFAHGNVAFRSGRTEQGHAIGEVGDTGNAKGTSPHVHFAIATSAAVFDRLRGSGDINFDSTYWTTRDRGYLFREPTMTVGLRSGERNLIAERRPELLVGGAATARMMRTPSLIGPAPLPDYAAMGAVMSAAHPGGSGSSSVVNEGDVIVNGIGLDEVVSKIERVQHRRRLLRGPR